MHDNKAESGIKPKERLLAETECGEVIQQASRLYQFLTGASKAKSDTRLNDIRIELDQLVRKWSALSPADNINTISIEANQIFRQLQQVAVDAGINEAEWS